MTVSRSLTPPPLRDDCFALPRGTEWTPVDTALAQLRDRLSVVVGAQSVATADAAGRVLADDVRAVRSNPPAANSAVDGYGVTWAETGSGAQQMPLVDGRAAAGDPFDQSVPAGHAVRILTGAILPDGVDTVILQEDVTTDGAHIAFRGPLRGGANARKAGEDCAKGEVILQAGRVLTPADLALATATGVATLPVRDRLSVAVLSTGDELCEAGSDAGPSRTYDANRPMLLELARRWGCDCVDLGIVADNRDALRAAFDRGAAEADVIISSGGASQGDEDHVSALLGDTGSLAHWKIALKPGRPLALGLWDAVPVFGLPGNPVAALICALIFARPALRALGGAEWKTPQGFDIPAAFAKSKKPGRREFLRARIRDGRAERFVSEGSGRISGLSWAEGLIELPDGAVEITEGTPVRYIPFASFDA